MPDQVDFLDDIVDEGAQNSAQAILPEEKPGAAPQKADTADVVAELERQKKGFYDNMKEERRKRQEIQSELDRVKGTVGAILEMRRQPAGDLLAPKPKFQGIPVKETEDGDLFVPADQLQSVVAPYEAKIVALEQRLQQSNLQRTVQDETEKVFQSIVGENESYGPAYQKYQAARKWINDQVIDYQRENGMRGPMTSGQALDTVFADDQVEKEFTTRFPGLNVEDVVQAEDSQRMFKRMLNNTVKTLQPKAPSTDERFRRVLNKPAGLGQTTNAKGAKLSMSEKLADLSPSDIMGLTDSQVKQMEKLLLEEEKNDGLSFSNW